MINIQCCWTKEASDRSCLMSIFQTFVVVAVVIEICNIRLLLSKQIISPTNDRMILDEMAKCLNGRSHAIENGWMDSRCKFMQTRTLTDWGLKTIDYYYWEKKKKMYNKNGISVELAWDSNITVNLQPHFLYCSFMFTLKNFRF